MFSLRVLCIYLLLLSTSHAEIRHASDLNIIQKEILASPKDTLVVFDVDFVLITPSDEIFIMQPTEEGSKFLAEVYTDLFKRYPRSEVDILQSTLLLNQEWRTVTPDTSKIFNYIKSSGYKIIGLTASETGMFGNIKSLEDWRINHLRNFNIYFSEDFTDAKAGKLDKYIEGISEHYSKSKHVAFPLVKDGIIFTAFIPKGKVLGAYLEYANIKPRKIIFIDDRLYNLESVQEFCDKNKIDYIGYEYTALKEQAKGIVLNTKRGILQYKILELTKTWLNDKQADELLILVNQH